MCSEFEYIQNDRWQDEPWCTNIVQTECDLTLALSSDSDYNVSVLARCDDATVWAQLPKSFNRRDSEQHPTLDRKIKQNSKF